MQGLGRVLAILYRPSTSSVVLAVGLCIRSRIRMFSRIKFYLLYKFANKLDYSTSINQRCNHQHCLKVLLHLFIVIK